MLRRVVRVLRIGLLGLGALCLVWLPVSFAILAFLSSPRWMPEVQLLVREGAIAVTFSIDSDQRMTDGFELVVGATGRAPVKSDAWSPLLPRITRPFWPEFNHTRLAIPLWLLAFLCLAWPVTSFILHRRRNKRGFAVEPKGDANASGPAPQRGA